MWRTPDRPREQVADPVLQDVVLRQTDSILDLLGFEILVDIGIGEARVGAEIAARDLALISPYDGLQHSVPSVSAVNIAGTKRAAFQVTELVEHEQRMIAGTFVMTVPDAALLFTVRRAHARIHVEQDATGRPAVMNAVDPLAGKISQRRKVLSRSEPLRLEAAHLARRGRTAVSRFAADNPAHRRIIPQALGVVHVLVSSKATKYRLPEQTGQCVPTILASACVGQNITRHRRQPEHVVEFAVGKQPSIGGHHGAAKLEHQAAVKIEPENRVVRFTRRVRIAASLDPG